MDPIDTSHPEVDSGFERAIAEARRRLLGRLTCLRLYLPPAVTAVPVTEAVSGFTLPPEAA